MPTDCKECSTCQRRRAKKYTAAEVVLLAIRKLDVGLGLDHFDHDAIAVEAWKLDSATFGMRGHPYPDSKRVSMEIVKLARLKDLELAEPRRYRLTDAGRERVRRLQTTG